MMSADTEERRLLRETLGHLVNVEARLSALESQHNELRATQAEILTQINKWRGALPVLIAIGGIMAWLVTGAEGLAKLLGKLG